MIKKGETCSSLVEKVTVYCQLTTCTWIASNNSLFLKISLLVSWDKVWQILVSVRMRMPNEEVFFTLKAMKNYILIIFILFISNLAININKKRKTKKIKGCRVEIEPWIQYHVCGTSPLNHYARLLLQSMSLTLLEIVFLFLMCLCYPWQSTSFRPLCYG